MSLRLWLVCTILQFVGKCCSDIVITECQNGKATVGEGTTVTLKCGKYSVNMEWTYDDDSGSVIGQCNKTTCTTHHNISFSLQAHETGSNQYESVLSITNTSSKQTFHLKCRNNDLDETAKCQLDVVKPPQYDLTSCKVWLSNWRVLGECTVERMLASGVNYNCHWSVNNKGNFGGFKDKSYYTLHSVNYTRRVCSFDRRMNFSETAYTYSMNVAGLRDHFTKIITVEHPGEATHDCPTMVREGSSVSCRCNSSKAGNPPAETMWDGVMNETLHIANIQRQDNTNVYTCRLVWGSDGQINRSTLYTFEVAYGPLSVRIDNITDETGNERYMIRLICTAVDVYPSAIFRWSITCDNQTQTSNTSTCAFSPASVSPETVVTCTAVNNVFTDMSSFTSFVVNGTGGKSPATKEILTVIIISSFLVLIFIITATALVSIYKRKVLMSKRQESSTCATLPETEESAPERDTFFSHNVSTMAEKEENEKGAQCNNDTIQSNTSTEYHELGEHSAPERCAAPSGDLYTKAFKGNDHLNSEKCDHNNLKLEAVIQDGASNFVQDEIDMSGLYANEVKFVKKSGTKRYTGDLIDLYTGVDEDKNKRDAQFCQGASQLIRSASNESDIQSALEGCVDPSRDVYVNVSETCNRLDNENSDQHSLMLETANEDLSVPTTSNAMETTVKSGKSSKYLHPLPDLDHDVDTYNRLMA